MSRSLRIAIFVWLLLMVGTAVSTWWFSMPGVGHLTSTLSVMLISAFKVGLVMMFFMELRSAPRPWQIAGLIWIAAVTSTVMLIYLL